MSFLRPGVAKIKEAVLNLGDIAGASAALETQAVERIAGGGDIQATRALQRSDQLVDIAAGLQPAQRADGALTGLAEGQQHYEEQQRQRSVAALKRRAAALGFEISPTTVPSMKA